MNVQRWTGLVEANDNGGFVAVGDYMELRAENERLKQSVLDELPVLEKLNSRFGEVCIERDTLRAQLEQAQAENDRVKEQLAHISEALTNANKFMHQFATERDAAQADAARLRDTRCKVKLGSQYGSDLAGHWFFLNPADEHAEAALTKHSGIALAAVGKHHG